MDGRFCRNQSQEMTYCSSYFVFVVLISGGGTGDTLPLSLGLSLVVSLTALVAFVVLLVNCVTCCKEREINFKVRVHAQRSEEATSDELKLHQTVFLSWFLWITGVWGPLWRWDWLHSTSRGHTFYSVPSWSVHPCRVPHSSSWTTAPPTSWLHHR